MSGVQGTHIANVRSLLSVCDSWQVACGIDPEAVDAATQALAYIHQVDTEGDPDAPYAVVMPGDTQYTRISTGGGSVATGTVDVLIALSPAGDSLAAKWLAFDWTISDILAEMDSQCDNGYALITSMAVSKDTYGRTTDPERRGRSDKYAAIVTLSFGVR